MENLVVYKWDPTGKGLPPGFDQYNGSYPKGKNSPQAVLECIRRGRGNINIPTSIVDNFTVDAFRVMFETNGLTGYIVLDCAQKGYHCIRVTSGITEEAKAILAADIAAAEAQRAKWAHIISK